MTDAQQTVSGWVRHQAVGSGALGSSLYRDLMQNVAIDVDAGGPCWEVLKLKADDRFGNAIPLRFMGGVHRLALEGMVPELAAFYPSCGGTLGDSVSMWRAFHSAVEEFSADLGVALEQGVQTNEVQRSAALAPGLVAISTATGRPVNLLEIGTSGGLNLRLDHFGYTGIDGQRWGDPNSMLQFADQYSTPVPLAGGLSIIDRAGCDPNPIDPTTTSGANLLRSFVWPDQLERLARFDAAVQIAANVPARTVADTAIEFLRRELADAHLHAVTVVMHSIVWQYIDKAERAEIAELFEQAGAGATAEAPLAWMRFEPLSPAAPHAGLVVRLWPGDSEIHLADVGYHGEFVRWLAPS